MMRRSPMPRSKTPLRSKPKRHTKAENLYLASVAMLGCQLCKFLGYGETACEVHHQRTGTGMMRASHYRTVGLCPEHHRGKTGVHAMGREEFAAMYGISEVELIEQTRAELAHLLTGENE